MPSSTQDAPPERLEDAMHRLEEIIGQMDDEDLSIDELLQRYQQGTELLGNCRRQITEFRNKVEKITKTLEENSAELESFEDEA